MKKAKTQYSKKATHRVRLSIKKRKHLEAIFGKKSKKLNDEDLVLLATNKRKKISFLSKTYIEKRKV